MQGFHLLGLVTAIIITIDPFLQSGVFSFATCVTYAALRPTRWVVKLNAVAVTELRNLLLQNLATFGIQLVEWIMNRDFADSIILLFCIIIL